MRVQIRSLEIKNFKGVREAKYAFVDGKNIMLGANATGKTTIASAYMWLLEDCDYDLKSNPPIFPIGVEECTPTVTAELEIDGKPVRISKSQTRKISKPDVNGVRKESYTNNYTINDVPKSQTDFKADLTERGINFDTFLALSHFDVFCSGKKDEQRKVLFDMASSITDIDVARKVDGLEELVSMLENYKVEEILAMNKRTLKEIDENYGKHGEILNAKIEGLESAKVQIDVSDAELGISSASEKLASVENQIKELSNKSDDFTNLSKEIMMLKATQINMVKADESSHMTRVSNLKNDIATQKSARIKFESQINNITAEVERKANEIKNNEETIVSFERGIDEITASTFNENSLSCPTCGRKYAEKKQEDIRKAFEREKAMKIANLEDLITNLEKKNASLQTDRMELATMLDKATADISKIDAEIKSLENQLDATNECKISVEDSKEYAELSQKIADKERELAELKASIDSISLLNAEANVLRRDIEGYKVQIAKADTSHIDEEIANLRKAQINYEQKKADAEKIKYMVETLNKAKNIVLEESVNKNFDVVKFKLFETLKNGEVKDACIPTIEGKILETHCNRGLQTLAKLDIIKGLQRYYDSYLPVFLDNAESLDSITTGKVNMDCQTIFLKVSEDKELTIGD